MDEAALLEDLVRRIRAVVEPDRIVLFGSRARGNAREGSDFDVLVIAASEAARWRRTAPLYRALAGMGIAKDLLWWTPGEIEEWRSVRGHVIQRALEEGRTLYERAA